MSNYRKKATNDRDALFGGLMSGGGGSSNRDTSNKKKVATTTSAGMSTTVTSRPSSSSSSSAATTQSASNRGGYQPSHYGIMTSGNNNNDTNNHNIKGKMRTKSTTGVVLSPEAMSKALAEAEDYRTKANQAMQSGLWKRSDPVAASTYFKRAADAYQRAGSFHMERLFRTSSADCNMQIRAWASAANDYTRAAILALQELEQQQQQHQQQQQQDEGVDNKEDTLRREAYALHHKAATAWTEMNERAKAAASTLHAAMALHASIGSGDDDDDQQQQHQQQQQQLGGKGKQFISREALTAMEEAVEAHVPDVLNPYGRYRQTGHSAFVDPTNNNIQGETVDTPSANTIALAQAQMVSRSYAHEPVQELIYLLVSYQEYASALYAAGAATALLQADGISTLSLSRAFVTETIIQLALGDVVGAEQSFLQRHIQVTSYLSSRECALAEDLFRAVKNRDSNAFEEARSPTGPHRTALANLHSTIRQVVVDQLRLSGIARKGHHHSTKNSNSNNSNNNNNINKNVDTTTLDEQKSPKQSLSDLLQQKTGYEQVIHGGNDNDDDDDVPLNAEALDEELDALNFGSDNDDDDDSENQELNALEDDDIDLR